MTWDEFKKEVEKHLEAEGRSGDELEIAYIDIGWGYAKNLDIEITDLSYLKILNM